MSNSSSSQDLSDCYVSVSSDDSPSRSPTFQGKGEIESVFVNRHLDLSEIHCYGFDMDYTVCEYLSPALEQLSYNLAKQFLVNKRDYPQAILDLQYDDSLAVRGSWYDRVTGHMLIVDQLGYILNCTHGTRQLSAEEMRALYPSGRVKNDPKRMFVMNTMFNLPEMCLISQMIHWLQSQPGAEQSETGFIFNERSFTFSGMFQDLRDAIDDMHVTSLDMKTTILKDPGQYIKKDPRLAMILERFKSNDKKVFLLTNSDWWYTNNVMTFILGNSWTSFFDFVVVDASKPRFFSTTRDMARLESEAGQTPVYSGGDEKKVRDLLGEPGHNIIYFGDHLPADVMECSLHTDWRTCLIVPELQDNYEVIKEDSFDENFTKLKFLGQTDRLQSSLFRAGSYLTEFGSNLRNYSDVYTGSVCNMLQYDSQHSFEANQTVFLPHC